MEDRLARVVDDLTDRTMRLAFTRMRPTSDPRKLKGGLFWVINAPKLVLYFARMMRQLVPLSTHPVEEVIEAYRDATGTDRDQATADINAIEERLRRLPDFGDATAEPLVRQAARRLVEWAVAERPPGDERWKAMQTAYEALAACEDDARGDWGSHYRRHEELQDKYQEAWRRVLSNGTP